MSSIEFFSQQLQVIVGHLGWISDSQQIQQYNLDWRGRIQGNAPWVVRPNTVEQISNIVKLCQEHRIPIVPQAGNTSHCGGSVPLLQGAPSLILNVSRLNTIRQMDWDNNTLCCEAGITLAQLQTLALSHKKQFGVSMASEGSAQVGGAIATNAGGTAVLKYGSMRQQVLGLEVVLADGTVWNGLRALRKDNTGYDLKQLFIGSEGTLGIITAATLKVTAKPEWQTLCWVALDTPQQALDLFHSGSPLWSNNLTAFELMNQTSVGLVEQHFKNIKIPTSHDTPWCLLMEVQHSLNDTFINELEYFLQQQLEKNHIRFVTIAQSQTQQNQLWAIREHIPEAQKREGISLKHDISLPLSQIPHFIHHSQEHLLRQFPGIRIVCFGHLGDGNLHYNISYSDPANIQKLTANGALITRSIHDLVNDYNGSFSAEHGIGQLKVSELAHYRSAIEINLMRQIKKAFDPNNLLNPGKILASP